MPSTNVNNVWASNTPAGATEELTLASGQTCEARKMSIESMIEAGMLAEADALTAQVSKHARKVRGGNKKPDGIDLDEKSFLRDASGVKSMITLMDRAMPHIVVSPRVVLHYTETKVNKTTVTKALTQEQREEILAESPGTVFTDQIDFSDKVELFNWAAGGLAAMLQFRQ